MTQQRTPIEHLRIRAERLIKLMNLNAPSMYIARETWLVFSAGMAVHEAGLELMSKHLWRNARAYYALCTKCDSKVPELPDYSGMCERCDFVDDKELNAEFGGGDET
jgi:hypothetical protein